MDRRHYLVSYDISDDKDRTAVFHLLRDHGDHAQYSVFFCALTTREIVDLCGRLNDMINHDTDQVLVLDLGPSDNPLDRGMRCIGKPFVPTTRVLVV